VEETQPNLENIHETPIHHEETDLESLDIDPELMEQASGTQTPLHHWEADLESLDIDPQN
jgi:hypothetical protein